MEIKFKRISDAILNSGYSYAELSKLTGISKSSLQRYATGETKKISLDCVEAIASATGRDARYLMGWEDEKSAPTENGESEKKKDLTSRQERIVKLFDELTEPQQDNIIGRAELLAEQNENDPAEEGAG